MKRVLTILLVVVLALSLGTVFAPAQKAVAADGIYNVPSPSYPTIQAAIDAAYAAGGGTVNVAPGVYREGFISLKSGVKVLGAGWNVTALDGGGTSLLVLAQNVDSTAVLSGFTITNGKFAPSAIFLLDSSPVITDCFIIGNEATIGGGMLVWGGSPTVTNCTFYANKAGGDGGGMYNSGTATVTNCNFYGNEASDDGGGMYSSGTATVTNCNFFLNEASTQGGGMLNDGTATVTNCTFSTNKADEGGGMYNDGTATVTNCNFQGNEASTNGGGMYNYGSSPMVTNCTFFLNEADIGGGGMFMLNCDRATVTNCNFYANEALHYGGGMSISGGTATVTNCTFSTNKADIGGGGMSISGDFPTVTNCVLWGDTAATGAEIYPPGKDVTYCDIQGGYTGEGNINTDPMFADPGNLDFHLLPGSPCIDAGNDDAPGLPATDFEGDPRIMGAAVDMGIDEAPGATNEPPVAQDDSATTDEDTPVTISVLANDSDPDEDDLTVVEVTQGANGSVAINEDDTVTYTPNPDFNGTDSFTYTVSDGKDGTATATVTVTVNPLVIQVIIDIKPGSEPNSINLGSKGVVPVAVLTTDDFDAGRVDPATVVFAGAAPERWTSEDVDGDGDPDLLFHFRTQELDLTEDSEDATLTGWTTDGHEITGTDSVRIVPPKGKK